LKIAERTKSFDTNLPESVLEDVECPFCGSKETCRVKYQGLFCTGCNAKIEVSGTTGDKGFVVKADPSHIWKEEADLDPELGELTASVLDFYFHLEDDFEILWRDEDGNVARTQNIDPGSIR